MMRRLLLALLLLAAWPAVAQTISSDPYVSTGTWTPTDQSGAGLAFSSPSAAYTRVGNMVFVYGRFTYPSTGSGSAAKVGGLPFTVANQTYAQSGGTLIVSGASQTASAVPNLNTTNFTMLALAGAASITNANLSTTTVIFSFSYPIN